MSDFELKIQSRDINTLVNTIKLNNPKADTEVIKKAYDFAYQAHKDDVRLSGEPYIIHPLEVGLILAKLKLDTTTITAAILHDVVEDTKLTLNTIEEEFNEEIARLVDGVTKISSIKNRSKAIAQAETLRKMLIATINDVRVIIIKLADKLHNMRTIMFHSPEKRERIASETLDIYAPLARRLGMSKICSELEDLSFHVIYPGEYDKIKKMITHRKVELEDYITDVKDSLIEKLGELKIEAEITGRAKHFYSIFRKMKIQDKTFKDIYDIRGIRILTEEVKDCYGILGVIHTLWSPIATRFKDYIAVPKSNMYQSLHTTVIGPKGFPLEVQIRTTDMHHTAEMGIAAHWKYKENLIALKVDYMDVSLLQDITKLDSESDNPVEFLQDLKMDLYEHEIFVFTPKGKIIKLAKDSTPVDFAFAIHTEVGYHTTGAKVNNKMVPLKTSLNSGDIIEIFTSNKGHPSEAWLKSVKSSRARYKIRNYLKKQTESKTNPHKAERIKDEKDDNVLIPEEEQIRFKKISKREKMGVSVDGTSDVLIKLSQCCQPIPGDNVIGFITRGRGITIHKKNCPSLRRLTNEKERLIDIVWEGSDNRFYPIKLAVEGIDRQNLLKDIIDEISQCKTNIVKMEGKVKNKNEVDFKFILEVKSNDHLNLIISTIKKIKGITDSYKLNEKVVIK